MTLRGPWRYAARRRAVSGVSITTCRASSTGARCGVPIREETRSRVLTLAAELGYKPNLLARGPARQPQLAAGGHRPRHRRPVPHPGPAGHQRRGPGTRLPDVPGPRRLPARRGPDAMARCSSARTRTASSSSATSRATTDALDLLASQHRYVAGRDRPDRPRAPRSRACTPTASWARSWRSTTSWELGHRSIVCVSDARTHDGRLRIDRLRALHARAWPGGAVRMYVTDQEPAPSVRAGSADLRGGRRSRPRRRPSTPPPTRPRSG